MEQSRTRVALYARVSSTAQDVDLSISGQLKGLREFALKHGYEVAGEYVDEAESGKSARRPVFQEMVSAARRKPRPFDAVLVWKLSRFARSREDSILYKSLLRKHGVQVVSMNEPIENSPTGKMIEGVIETLDEFYSANMAQDIVRGMREAVSRGFWVGSRTPYGYRRIYVQDGSKQRSKLEPDPVTAPTVGRVFDLAASGLGSKEIASRLNADAVPAARGRLWGKSRVYDMLINPVYAGTLVWGISGGYHKGNGLEPVRVAGAAPAIVTQETFDAVQQVLRSRSPQFTPPRRVSSQYLLSGLLKCGKCKASMFGVPAKGARYHYYVCGTAFRAGRATCSGRSVRRDVIERLAVRKLQEVVLKPAHLAELLELVNEEADRAGSDAAARLAVFDGQIGNVRQKLERLYDAVESGALAMDDLAPRIREQRSKLDALHAARVKVIAAPAERPMHRLGIGEVEAYVRDIEELLRHGSVSEQRTVLTSFVKKIERGEYEATVFYTLPLPPRTVPTEAETVLDIEDVGGAEGTRTPYLLLAKQALYQLSYSPEPSHAQQVRVPGFEPGTPSLSATCSYQLSYTRDIYPHQMRRPNRFGLAPSTNTLSWKLSAIGRNQCCQ